MILGSLFALLSVVFGAFGAHALKASLSEYFLGIFETACRYQMYHAFALFIVAFCLEKNPNNLLQYVAVFFVLGILLFSGSLYLLVLTKVKAWGAVTPLGGLSFILGWVFLMCAHIFS